MELTTVARVKALAFGEEKDDIGTNPTALLTTLVADVSARVSTLLGRHVLSTSYAEEYKIRQGAKILQLKGYPVASVTSVTYSGDPNDTDATALDADDDYWLEASTGVVTLLLSPTDKSPGFVRTTYTGGMAADTDAFVAAYPDIASAVDKQVVYEFSRAKNPGGTKTTTRDAAVMFVEPINLLPIVREVVEMYSLEAL